MTKFNVDFLSHNRKDCNCEPGSAAAGPRVARRHGPPIDDAPADDRRVIVPADFMFEVREPSPTPQRVRIFKCKYGSVLRVVR
jgi:hypothetical protein